MLKMLSVIRGSVTGVDSTMNTVTMVRQDDNSVIACIMPEQKITTENTTKKRPLYFQRGDVVTLLGTPTSPTTFSVKDVVGVQLPTSIDNFKYFIISNSSRSLDNFHATKIYDALQGMCKVTGAISPEDQLSVLVDSYFKGEASVLLEDFRTMTYTNSDGKITQIFKGESFEILMTSWRKLYDRRSLLAMGLTEDDIEKSGYSDYSLLKQLKENPYLVPSITKEKCEVCDIYTGRTPLSTDVPCHNIKRRMWLNTYKKKYSCTSHVDLARQCRGFERYIPDLTSTYGVIVDHVMKYRHDDSVGNDKTGQISVVPHYYLEKQYQVVMKIRSEIVRRMKDSPYFKLGQPQISNHKLDNCQRQGIETAMNSNVTIITGPAGSGKTTLLKELCRNLDMHRVKYAIASFTGKAVVRARQMSGVGERVATLHRMLSGNTENADFQYLIIDEATMTSNELFYDFLCAYTGNYPILFIGDVNQLQPIDWGLLFKSLIDSRSIPTVHLTNIHRVMTAEGYEDGIIKNTTAIASWPDGKKYVFKETPNFMSIESDIMKIADIIQSYKDAGIPSSDVTVLCPYSKSYGVPQLNTLIQLIWNNGNKEIEKNGKTWIVGGRVMMLNNNYHVDVFNGQEGVIVDVTEEYVEVNFPFVQASDKKIPLEKCEVKQTGALLVDGVEMISCDKLVRFPFKFPGFSVQTKETDANNKLHISCIQLSYVISVHKSQGSEWPHIIYFIPVDAKMAGGFITREMTYVALSRASKMVFIVGSPYKAIQSIEHSAPYRCEMLVHYFKDDLPRLYNYVEKVFTFSEDVLITAEECGYDEFDDEEW